MAKFVFGTACYIGWVYAGSTVALTPNYTTMKFNMSGEQADTTSGSQTWKTHLPTLAEWSADLTLFFDSGSSLGTADFAKMIVSNIGVFVFGQFGTATGSPKYGGSATIGKHDMSGDFETPSTIDLSFVGNGQPYWNHGSAW